MTSAIANINLKYVKYQNKKSINIFSKIKSKGDDKK